MRELALPLAITLLAVAVLVHAVAPARADIPPEPPLIPELPVPAPVTAPPPECQPIRLGTTREYEKVIASLTASGHREIAPIGTGMVCGW